MIEWINPKEIEPQLGEWLCLVKASPSGFLCDLRFCTYTERYIEDEEGEKVKIKDWDRSGVIAYSSVVRAFDNSLTTDWMKENFDNSEWDERIREHTGMTGAKAREILGPMCLPFNKLGPGHEVSLISFFKRRESKKDDMVLSIDGSLSMDQLEALNWYVQNTCLPSTN